MPTRSNKEITRSTYLAIAAVKARCPNVGGPLGVVMMPLAPETWLARQTRGAIPLTPKKNLSYPDARRYTH